MHSEAISARPSTGSVRPRSLALAPVLLTGALALLAAFSAFRGGVAATTHPARSSASAPTAGAALRTLDRLPLSFAAAAGTGGRYVARGPGFAFAFQRSGVGLALAATRSAHDRPVSLSLRFAGADPRVRPVARHEASGTFSDLRADGSTRAAKTYRQVLYRSLWPGVDLRFAGSAGSLKYAFTLAPGAQAGRIAMSYAGARGVTIGRDGELRVATGHGVLTDSAPRAFQRIAGRTVAVPSRYVLHGDGGYGFLLGSYDRRRPLIIDPGIAYSTFLGGSTNPHSSPDDQATSVAVDASGAVYVAGQTFATDFPTTAGAYDRSYNDASSGVDTFVTKFSPNAAGVAYSTYLGGNDRDVPAQIVVGADGAAYLAGQTKSSDFPTTTGAFDRSYNGGLDAYAVKLAPSGGSLVYSTYLGGQYDDEAVGLAISSAGVAYLLGDTAGGFPTTPGSYDTTYNNGNHDEFVTQLSADGQSLGYSTYLGGSGDEGNTFERGGIALAPSGVAYVTGDTTSTNFPTTTGAYQTAASGGGDIFLTQISAAGNSLAYSTYIGGAHSDRARAIAIDSAGAAYVGGYTSSGDYPVTFGASHNPTGDRDDALLTKITSSGALAYSRLIGGTNNDEILGVAVDGSGAAYVTGYTFSSDFPSTTGSGALGGRDAFLTKLTPSGLNFAFSTYIGGQDYNDEGDAVALDPRGTGGVYVVGQTFSPDFPHTAGTKNGNFTTSDAFVLRWDDSVAPNACIDTDGNGTTDNDGDGLCDNWETSGIDSTGDGVPDLRLYDTNGDGTISPTEQADPKHKDLYVELDYMTGQKPNQDAVNDVVAAFAAGSPTNPDGTTGVRLHVQVDQELAESDKLQFKGCTTLDATKATTDFDALKSLGTAVERASPGGVLGAKRMVFRYGIFAHDLYDDGSTSGCSELPGNDFVVSLGSWTPVAGHGQGSRAEQAGTFMHEFGHTLGLHHGGGDDFNCKPNYLSVMSYARQTPSAVAGRPLDYSRSALPTLDESNLNETLGIGGLALDQTIFGPKPATLAGGTGGIDWNRDKMLSSSGVTADVNKETNAGCSGAGTVLPGYDDWSNLLYDFRGTTDYADGVHKSTGLEPEINQTQDLALTAVVRPTEGPHGDATCADGIDNDADGLLDGADSSCAVVTTPAGTTPVGTTPTGSGPGATAPPGTAPPRTAPPGTAPPGTAPPGAALPGTAPPAPGPAAPGPAGPASAGPARAEPAPGGTAPAHAGSEPITLSDKTVSAVLKGARFVRGTHRRRTLRLTLATQETVSVDVRLRRGRRSLRHASIAPVPAGNRTVNVSIPPALKKGAVTLTLMLVDRAGNHRTLIKRVVLPAAR